MRVCKCNSVSQARLFVGFEIVKFAAFENQIFFKDGSHIAELQAKDYPAVVEYYPMIAVKLRFPAPI